MLVEIEVRNDRNDGLCFRPTGQRLRGHLDYARANNKEAFPLVREFPNGIPGQRLALDTEAGTATVVEPLQDPGNKALREKIAAKGHSFAPERAEAQNVDVPTYLYWMKRAVDSGVARLVKGAFPDKIPGKVRKQFNRPETETPEMELRRQEQAARLAMMTPAQRKEYERILAESV